MAHSTEAEAERWAAFRSPPGPSAAGAAGTGRQPGAKLTVHCSLQVAQGRPTRHLAHDQATLVPSSRGEGGGYRAGARRLGRIS